MEAMLTSREAGFEFEVAMIVVCVQSGFGLDWVPIRTIYAGEDSHINSGQHLLNFLRLVWQTRQQGPPGKMTANQFQYLHHNPR